jgi:hypothetical protein
MNLKRFLVTSLLASSLVMAFSPMSVFASPIISTSFDVTAAAVSTSDDVSTQGIKSWITKAALKAASKALRAGGSIVDKVASELGAKEAKYFTKNTDTIADVLDDLSKEAEVLEQRVIDQIAGALYDVGVPLSVARTIGNIFTFVVF